MAVAAWLINSLSLLISGFDLPLAGNFATRFVAAVPRVAAATVESCLLDLPLLEPLSLQWILSTSLPPSVLPPLRRQSAARAPVSPSFLS